MPRSADAPEGDGWLLCIVGRRAENRSDLVILDALQIDRGPVAVVKFPCRVHEGFHGCWATAQALALAADASAPSPPDNPHNVLTSTQGSSP